MAPELVKFVPILLKLITVTAREEDNVKEYHTSSLGLPVAQPAVKPVLPVALLTVPVVFVTPKVKDTALLQSSFPGAAAYEKILIVKLRVNNTKARMAVNNMF